MTVNTRELIEAVSVVAENHNLRVTVKSSLRASLLVAGTTFVGGVLMGPVGLLIGATGGGLYSFKQARGTFKSAATVLRDELTVEQQNQLSQHIHQAFRDFSPQDLIMLIPLLTTNVTFQQTVIARVVQFLVQEMQMQIID